MTEEDPHVALANALNEIADSMLSSSDIERDHGHADAGLLRAIRLLAESRTPEIKRAAARIDQMFRGLEKWYA